MDSAPRLLVIVRHGKAESGEEGSDHDRRLTSRGETDAAATGRWLAGQVERVDDVWVSSATRAQQTWAAVRAALPEAAAVTVGRDLYQAGPRDVLERLAGSAGQVTVVVGHNPTMEQVVMALTGDLHGLRPSAAAVIELGGGGNGTGTHGRLLGLHQPTR